MTGGSPACERRKSLEENPLTPDPSPPRHFVFPARGPAQAEGRGEPNRARCGGMTQLPDELTRLPDELELTLPPLAQQKPGEEPLNLVVSPG